MSRAGLIFPCLIVLACRAPVSAGESFELDLQGQDLREKFHVTAVEDLSIGESGYILASSAKFCRWSDSEIRLLGRTLLTEPSEFGDRWEIAVNSDKTVSLTYQIGTEQTDPDASLRAALVEMSYADTCDEVVDHLSGVPITLMMVSSINGHGSLSAIAYEFAERRAPADVSTANKDPLRTARQELNQIHLEGVDLKRDDPWALQDEVSTKYGRIVSLYTFSREKSKYDESGYAAHFNINCEEGQISAEISKPELVFYRQDFMWVTYKIGSQKARSRQLLREKRRGLLVWPESESTRFIHSLLDADVLLMKVRLTEGEWLFLTFEIHGLREQLEPLAEACDWEIPIN